MPSAVMHFTFAAESSAVIRNVYHMSLILLLDVCPLISERSYSPCCQSNLKLPVFWVCALWLDPMFRSFLHCLNVSCCWFLIFRDHFDLMWIFHLNSWESWDLCLLTQTRINAVKSHHPPADCTCMTASAVGVTRLRHKHTVYNSCFSYFCVKTVFSSKPLNVFTCIAHGNTM